MSGGKGPRRPKNPGTQKSMWPQHHCCHHHHQPAVHRAGLEMGTLQLCSDGPCNKFQVVGGSLTLSSLRMGLQSLPQALPSHNQAMDLAIGLVIPSSTSDSAWTSCTHKHILAHTRAHLHTHDAPRRFTPVHVCTHKCVCLNIHM